MLTPELQTYFLTCVKAGIDGVEPNRGRGLATAAKGDDQQLVADVTGKIDAMLKIVSKKRKDDKLDDSDIRKMQALTAELEAIFQVGEAEGEGKTEQARAAVRP